MHCALLDVPSASLILVRAARGFFSLLTLKGAPILAAASAVSGFAYPSTAARRPSVRAALLALNVAVVWLVGAAIAFALLA